MPKRKVQGMSSAAKRQKVAHSQPDEDEVVDVETRKATSNKLSSEASVLFTTDSQNWDLCSWVSNVYNHKP